MMRSSQNVAIVKSPFRLRAMAFSDNRLLFLYPWERGFEIGNSGTQLATVVHNWQQWYWEPSYTPASTRMVRLIIQ